MPVKITGFRDIQNPAMLKLLLLLINYSVQCNLKVYTMKKKIVLGIF